MRDQIYNPLDDNTLKNPYPVFTYLRENHPVYWHKQMESWVLTRYTDCRQVLTDSETWARDMRRIGVEVPEERINMQSIDPPKLLPLRAKFNDAFKAFDTNKIAKFTYDTIETLLKPLVARKKFCLMNDFALPASDIITCEIFGLEKPSNNDFHEISYVIALYMDSGLVPERRDKSRQDAREASKRLRALVEQGFKLCKEGGLFASVIKAVEDSDYSDNLMKSSMDAMLNAAHSTMYTSFGSFSLTLAQNPHLLSKINYANLALATNEFLRYTSPAQATSRYATKEVKIGNMTIRPHDTVVTMFAAANRDPEVFEAPDEINVNRTINPHLSFGFGPHMCLGAMLARIISKQFLRNMINLPQLHIKTEPIYFRTATLRWMKSFECSFRK